MAEKMMTIVIQKPKANRKSQSKLQLLVVGNKIHVRRSCSDTHGWVATSKVICYSDNPGEIPVVSSPAHVERVKIDDNRNGDFDNDDSSFTTKRRKPLKPRTPFHAEWLVPLIKFMI